MRVDNRHRACGSVCLLLGFWVSVSWWGLGFRPRDHKARSGLKLNNEFLATLPNDQSVLYTRTLLILICTLCKVINPIIMSVLAMQLRKYCYLDPKSM